MDALALDTIAPYVAEATRRRHATVYRTVVDAIVEATPIRPLDVARAALEQRAIAALFQGTEWLTADQIGRLRDPKASNPHSSINRWRSERRVFAISKGGKLYYPRYAFDETLDPLPGMQEVIAALDATAGAVPGDAGLSPFRLASWFESPNGHLAGPKGAMRPRELIARRPAAVLAAAQAHATGPVHG